MSTGSSSGFDEVVVMMFSQVPKGSACTQGGGDESHSACMVLLSDYFKSMM